MILYDHGSGTRTTAQSAYADLDVEWRAGTTQEADSKALALKWRLPEGHVCARLPGRRRYNYSTNTDDTRLPSVCGVDQRAGEPAQPDSSGERGWINPYYHTTNDIESSYTLDDDADGKRDDIELGYNAVQDDARAWSLNWPARV